MASKNYRNSYPAHDNNNGDAAVEVSDWETQTTAEAEAAYAHAVQAADEIAELERATRTTDGQPVAPGTKLFDITCVIGSVYAGDGNLTPRQAAFLMIADYHGDGEFHFPNDKGGETIVGVSG